jgi:transposase
MCVLHGVTTDGSTTFSPANNELEQLRREVDLLRTHRQQLTEALAEQTRQRERLEYQFQLLLRRFTGRSSEKLDKNQLALFEKLLEQLAPATPAPPAAAASPVPGASVNGAPHGRRKIPADLPRERVIHDLPEEQKPCPCCGQMRHVIGKQVRETFDWVPAKVKVIEHVRLTYACRHCEQAAVPSGPQIITADPPSSPIAKGLAEPGLLAQIIVSKYGDHLPLHRLERIFERHGIDIARSTMCDWMANCAGLLRPLYALMVKEVLASKVIHTDDTSVQVLDKNLPETRTGRFWVYLGDRDHPYTVFDHTATRERDGPMKFLNGWGKGKMVYLQADAYGGYDGIHKGEAGGSVTEVACWSHARRKFYDAKDTDPATATQALAFIRLLYDVEDQAKELSPSERAALRQEQSLPRLAEFRTWLESRQAAYGGPVLPKSPLGHAITYVFNQWNALCVYITDGDLAIDNNASERALRRIAVGRNNWIFVGSDAGGHTAAVLFSFIATCRRHNVNIFDYLRDVLARIPACSMSRLAQFLPDRWQPAPAVAPV